jgi:Zn-dependent protease with chaperone function
MAFIEFFFCYCVFFILSIVVTIIDSILEFKDESRKPNKEEYKKILRSIDVIQKNSCLGSDFFDKITISVSKSDNLKIHPAYVTIKNISLSSFFVTNSCQNHLDAVIAHEIGHIFYGHKFHIYTYAFYLSFKLYTIFLISIFLMNNLDNYQVFLFSIVSTAYIISLSFSKLYPITRLFSFVSRKKEYQADDFVKQLGLEKELISTFLKYKSVFKHSNKFNYLKLHPTTYKRIKKLRS